MNFLSFFTVALDSIIHRKLNKSHITKTRGHEKHLMAAVFVPSKKKTSDLYDQTSFLRIYAESDYFFIASAVATATATVAPTMGLLPMPRKPIISTCAGTELEPANCASECIRPMVSVMP